MLLLFNHFLRPNNRLHAVDCGAFTTIDQVAAILFVDIFVPLQSLLHYPSVAQSHGVANDAAVP
jgi:hypothetical protein